MKYILLVMALFLIACDDQEEFYSPIEDPIETDLICGKLVDLHTDCRPCMRGEELKYTHFELIDDRGEYQIYYLVVFNDKTCDWNNASTIAGPINYAEGVFF